MSSTSTRSDASVKNLDMKLEVVVIPVSDVDRAREFYSRLGWRQDQTPPGVFQFTPHGSDCSVQFGPTLTSSTPGSAKEYVIVSDIAAAQHALTDAGIGVGEIFHVSPEGPVSGPDPEHRSYFSRASFSDPDGNNWLLQEVTTRLPGRVEATATSFSSASDLANAMKRAAIAHGEHEKRIGEADPNWPDWYAEYMVTEQTGAEPPT